MKKLHTLALMSFALMAAFSLAACGDDDDDSGPGSGPGSDKKDSKLIKMEITYTAKPVDVLSLNRLYSKLIFRYLDGEGKIHDEEFTNSIERTITIYPSDMYRYGCFVGAELRDSVTFVNAVGDYNRCINAISYAKLYLESGEVNEVVLQPTSDIYNEVVTYDISRLQRLYRTEKRQIEAFGLARLAYLSYRLEKTDEGTYSGVDANFWRDHKYTGN